MRAKLAEIILRYGLRYVVDGVVYLVRKLLKKYRRKEVEIRIEENRNAKTEDDRRDTFNRLP